MLSYQVSVKTNLYLWKQVETLISPDVFKRPQAVLSVHIAGVSTGEISSLLLHHHAAKGVAASGAPLGIRILVCLQT